LFIGLVGGGMNTL